MSADLAAWRVVERDGFVLLRSALLEQIESVEHGFTTALDARGEPFDLGAYDDVRERTLGNRARFAASLGLTADALFAPEQVHGATIVRAEAALAGRPQADGVWAHSADGVAPTVRTADCVPVLLADVEGRAFAAVHAGWRGTAQRIVGAAVRTLESVGIAPHALRAAIGPAIGSCCYEVGDEVAAAVVAASGGRPEVSHRDGGRVRLDLQRANRLQLVEAGLAPEAVSCAPWCTMCSDLPLFSYRRDGSASGRQMASIAPARRRPAVP